MPRRRPTVCRWGPGRTAVCLAARYIRDKLCVEQGQASYGNVFFDRVLVSIQSTSAEACQRQPLPPAAPTAPACAEATLLPAGRTSPPVPTLTRALPCCAAAPPQAAREQDPAQRDGPKDRRAAAGVSGSQQERHCEDGAAAEEVDWQAGWLAGRLAVGPAGSREGTPETGSLQPASAPVGSTVLHCIASRCPGAVQPSRVLQSRSWHRHPRPPHQLPPCPFQVLVNFGSSWCSHCHQMFPHFLSLAKQFPQLKYAVAQVGCGRMLGTPPEA